MQIGYLKDLAILGDAIKFGPTDDVIDGELNINWRFQFDIISLKTDTGWIKAKWDDYELDGWNYETTDHHLNPDSLVIKNGENIYLLDDEIPEEINYYSPPPSPQMKALMESICSVQPMKQCSQLIFALKSQPTDARGQQL